MDEEPVIRISWGKIASFAVAQTEYIMYALYVQTFRLGRKYLRQNFGPNVELVVITL